MTDQLPTERQFRAASAATDAVYTGIAAMVADPDSAAGIAFRTFGRKMRRFLSRDLPYPWIPGIPEPVEISDQDLIRLLTVHLVMRPAFDALWPPGDGAEKNAVLRMMDPVFAELRRVDPRSLRLSDIPISEDAR